MRFRCHHPVPGSKRFLRAGGPVRAAVLGGANNGPSLDLNFVQAGAIDPRISFTRASGASYFDSTGTLQIAASNTPRFDYGPTQSGVTNWLRNSTMVGAVPGTPGTAPTNWALPLVSAGLSSQIVGTGVESGLSYVDIRWFGTSTSGGAFNDITFDTSTGIPAGSGQAWTLSLYVRLVAGTLTNVSNMFQRYIAWNSFPSLLGAFTGTTMTPTGAGLATQRNAFATTVSPATTASIQPGLRFSAALGAIDMTLRIGAPQAEFGASASTWVPTSGAAASQGGSPLLGLLIEEPRTNSISNARLEGAAIGTPGTYPTSNNYTNNTGIVPAITGFGNESGIPYIEFRLVGTTAGGTLNNFAFGSNATMTPSQTWTGSLNVRIVAGTTTNITAINLNMTDTITSSGIALTVTGAALATQRKTLTRTTDPSAVTSGNMQFQIVSTPGTAIDITLRIGAPQLELGAFATSIILPAIGTPAVTTRAGDSVILNNFGGIYNPNQGTAVAEFEIAQVNPTATQPVFAINDGTSNNQILSFLNANTTALQAETKVSAAFQTSGASIATPIIGATNKSGQSWSTTTDINALNGTTTTVTAGRSLPVVTRIVIAPNAALCSHYRRFRYWPRALSNADLQKATT